MVASRVAVGSSLASSQEQQAREVFRGNWQALSASSEMHAREVFRANWNALAASRGNTAYSARLTGQASEYAARSTQRANAAYSARLTGLAMQRANAAYTARLTGLAQEQRASIAYAARLTGLAEQQMTLASAQRAQAADTARWEAMAKFYAGQTIPVTGQN